MRRINNSCRIKVLKNMKEKFKVKLGKMLKWREQDMDRVKIVSGFHAYGFRLGTRAHTKTGS
jgi:hypothetical protein